MPAILADDEWPLWLDPELRDEALLRDLLQPAAETCSSCGRSALVNNANNEGADCVPPEPEPRSPRR